MNYILPQPHKCITCGHETEYSPHNVLQAPVTDSFIGCPKCWESFLKENIGELKCTVNFNGESDYEKQYKAQAHD
jgi:hypothetical protein